MFKPLAAILLALTAIAILTQGLTQLEIISDQRSSGLTYLLITLLAVPQLLALILPLAVFFAIVAAINRLLTDSELVVAFSAGMGHWQVIQPVFRLAVLAGLMQLGLALIAQPAAYREMRQMVYQIRGDPSGFLVREGAFYSPVPGLTIYTRVTSPGGVMRDLLIDDARDPKAPVTYSARTGAAAIVEGELALIMRDGQILSGKKDGAIDLLDFDQYVLQFADAMSNLDPLVMKPADRYLMQLLDPNMTSFYDQRMIDRFIAEAHSRLAAPLLSPALAMIALAFLLMGDFSRRGYTKRMVVASIVALSTVLLMLALQAAARETPALNAVQYIAPILVILACCASIAYSRRRRAPRQAPAIAAAAAG
ncbi:MAG: LptF/LptG family permease [Alphaproteobacteria bacterium]